MSNQTPNEQSSYRVRYREGEFHCTTLDCLIAWELDILLGSHGNWLTLHEVNVIRPSFSHVWMKRNSAQIRPLLAKTMSVLRNQTYPWTRPHRPSAQFSNQSLYTTISADPWFFCVPGHQGIGQVNNLNAVPWPRIYEIATKLYHRWNQNSLSSFHNVNFIPGSTAFQSLGSLLNPLSRSSSTFQDFNWHCNRCLTSLDTRKRSLCDLFDKLYRQTLLLLTS